MIRVSNLLCYSLSVRAVPSWRASGSASLASELHSKLGQAVQTFQRPPTASGPVWRGPSHVRMHLNAAADNDDAE